MGRNAYGHVADVTKYSEVEELCTASVNALGNLDVFIANAGIAQVKPLLELTEDDVRKLFEVNVFGVFNSYKAAAKQMIKQGTTPEKPGKIIGCSRYVSSCRGF